METASEAALESQSKVVYRSDPMKARSKNTSRPVAAIVLAAGSGTRMVSQTPKQFQFLGGRPLFHYSLEFFLALDEVDRAVLVLPEKQKRSEWADEALALADLAKKPIEVTEGGSRRQDSTLAGLRALSNDVEVVLVHDSARPFPPEKATLEAVGLARSEGGAILAAPAHDTIKQTDESGQRIEVTLDRSRMWLAQTPQVFQYGLLLQAMSAADRDGIEITDEAMALERLGHPVRLVASTADNMKVTRPDDWRRAELIAEELIQPREG